MEHSLDRYDYFYMFVLIIYMGQATPETTHMFSNFTFSLAFFLPIILTFILWTRKPISLFDKKLLNTLLIYLIWAALSLYKYGNYSSGEFSYHFFMVYAILIAYIQVSIYGYRLLEIYESVMVWICKVTICLWLISVLIPISREFFSMFPTTYIGTNVGYIFEWNERSIRNSGCAWEPGRYAIMVALAVYCNICRNGIRFRNNINIWWFLVSIASTLSTTGISTILVLYSIYIIKHLSTRTVPIYLIFIIPIIVGLIQLDFMGGKISTRLDDAQDVTRWKNNFAWHNENTAKDKYISSIDRFEATVFEWQNFKQDPLLGYGRNTKNSYFYRNLSSHHSLATGFMKVFAMYGVFLGIYFYYILYLSSMTISKESKEKQKYGLFILISLSSISYQVLAIPIFTSFWFYGLFVNKTPSD